MFTYLPALIMAVLACWLGLSLLARAPREPPARLFAWLCLHLTLYGLSAALPQVTVSPGVADGFLRLNAAESVLLTPIFLHFIAVLIGARSRGSAMRQVWPRAVPLWALAGLYAGSVALVLYALLSPAMALVEMDGWRTLRFPAGPLVALWLALRIVPLLLGLVLLFDSYRRTRRDDLERRRLALIGVAAIIGVAGALWIITGREIGLSPAPGHLLMALSLVLFAYAVLAYRALLPARVAQRAFLRSLLGGVLTSIYAGALVLLAPATERALGLGVPLVAPLALVALAALSGPLRDWAGDWLDRALFHREFDYGRLLRAVGDDLFERGDLAGQLHAALATICRTLDIDAGFVAVRDGPGLRALARHGHGVPYAERLAVMAPPAVAQVCVDAWDAWPGARLLLPLRQGDEVLGLLALGMKRSGEPYSTAEQALLNSLGGYLSLTIRHAHRQQEQELAMAVLAEQSRQLHREQEVLALQAAATREAAQSEKRSDGLRVLALGPLRVERGGVPIERWGGDKAGTYQAEALFAFLFDRRGRGVTKDEAAEVIWPDLPIERADMAFHRTISGLRRTLEPGLRRGNESRAIMFHHERYWLDPGVIAWCDIDAFTAAMERGHTLARRGETEAARAAFAEALAHYRGDYMDDCPFYGDSSYVEVRRNELRDMYIEALLALGGLYERLDQPGEAAAWYRRALSANAGDCPRAAERLERLQFPV
ncbi:MAG: GAF domain-containing protein [Chloroflexi bacterium]|nr:GAF domain-containing protein [Chloroflexota bacterium]